MANLHPIFEIRFTEPNACRKPYGLQALDIIATVASQSTKAGAE